MEGTWTNRKIEGRSTWLCVLSFHCFKASQHMCSRREAPQEDSIRVFAAWSPNCQGISGEGWAVEVEGRRIIASESSTPTCCLGWPCRCSSLARMWATALPCLRLLGISPAKLCLGGAFFILPSFLIASGSSWFRERHENIENAFLNLRSER